MFEQYFIVIKNEFGKNIKWISVGKIFLAKLKNRQKYKNWHPVKPGMFVFPVIRLKIFKLHQNAFILFNDHQIKIELELSFKRCRQNTGACVMPKSIAMLL